MVWLTTLIPVLVPIACGCVLPIMAIWLITRQRISESKDRTQIVLAALEKNPDLNVEELMKKMMPQRRSLKERMLSKVMWGSIITFMGVCFAGYGFYGRSAYNPFTGGDVNPSAIMDYGFAMYAVCIGVILFAVGIALLLYYFMGKRLFAREIEAEQKKLTELS